MPKPRGLGKRAIAAKRQNNAAVQIVLSNTKDTCLARVEKNLGSYFQLVYNDGERTYEGIYGSPRQVLSKIRIGAGDFVIVEGLEQVEDLVKRGKKVVCEITGILSRENVRELKKNGRIAREILAEQADEEEYGITFDFSDEETDNPAQELAKKQAKDKSKEATEAVNKKRATKEDLLADADDDSLDVDAI
jgi:hypothetical protein